MAPSAHSTLSEMQWLDTGAGDLSSVDPASISRKWPGDGSRLLAVVFVGMIINNQ
jgi:hypothetical protein